jgi:hypothetical protein
MPGPQTQKFGSVDLGWGKIVCIYNKLTVGAVVLYRRNTSEVSKTIILVLIHF